VTSLRGRTRRPRNPTTPLNKADLDPTRSPLAKLNTDQMPTPTTSTLPRTSMPMPRTKVLELVTRTRLVARTPRESCRWEVSTRTRPRARATTMGTNRGIVSRASSSVRFHRLLNTLFHPNRRLAAASGGWGANQKGDSFSREVSIPSYCTLMESELDPS
jgi:hypothetical protein